MFGKQRKTKPDELGVSLQMELTPLSRDYALSLKPFMSKKFYDDEDYQFNLIMFCRAFLFIAVDRQLFSFFGAEKHSEIVELSQYTLVRYINSGVEDFDNKLLTKSLKIYEKMFNKISKYGQIDLPDDGASPRGTLVWEFGSILAKHFKMNPGVQIAVVDHYVPILTHVLDSIGFKR